MASSSSSSSSSSFTTTQQIALALTPKLSAILSLVGSLWIVVEVTTEKLKRSTVFHRLLLGMSAVDIVSSCAFFASTWPIPKHTDDTIWATGGETSCTIQGFFIQVGVASPIYNALLSVYYVMIIRYGFTENRIRDKFEVWMHWIAIMFALLPALAGIQLDLYHSANMWCWIAPSPSELTAVADYCANQQQLQLQQQQTATDDFYNQDDDDDDDVFNEEECLEHTSLTHHEVYRWAFYYIVIWACLVFAIGCLAAVYGEIRQRELERGFNPRRGSLDVLKPSRYRRTSSSRRNGGVGVGGVGTTMGIDESSFSIYTQNSFIVDHSAASSKGSQVSGGGAASVVPPLLSLTMSWGSQHSERQSSINSSSYRVDPNGAAIDVNNKNNNNNNNNPTSLSERMSRRPSFRRTISNRSNNSYSLTGGGTRGRRQGSFTKTSTSSKREWLIQSRQERLAKERQEAKEAEAVIRAISQIKSSTHLSSVASSYASRQVYEQALLYTFVFLITYTFATINRLVQAVMGQSHFSLMLLHVLFMPLQGALNFLVYRRNAYRKLQLQYPHFTMWQTFIRTFRWSFLGPPKPVLPSMLDDGNYPNSSSEEGTNNKQQSPDDTAASVIANNGSGELLGGENSASGDSPNIPYDEMDDFDEAVAGLIGDDDVNRAVDDLMSSYADFPNLLTEDDMVVSSYPIIKFDDPIPEDRASTSSNCFMCPQDFAA